MVTALTAVRQPESQPLRAFLYARASRDPKKRGRSTDDQMTENRRECVERGWTWTPDTDEFVDDDRSASRHAKKGRDYFEAMVAGIKAGRCDVVVAWESSRFQRDLEVYVMLRRVCAEAGVLWCYADTVFDMSKRSDRRTTALDAIQAEDESEAIRLRNLRTTRLNAERGGPHGRIPYGYTRTYDAKTGDLLEQIPDPFESGVVRLIFVRLAAGDSASSIARYLNERHNGGCRTRRGELWSSLLVVRLVRNKPTYIGKRQHQGDVVGDALWPRIVEPELYYSVQQLLGSPARRTNRDSTVRHLLSGIAQCGVQGCGGRLSAHKNRGDTSYTCMPTAHVSIREHRLDVAVEYAVLQWLASPAAALAFQSADTSSDVARALAEIDRLTAELQEAQQLVVAHRLSVGSLAALEAGILPEIERHRRTARHTSMPMVVQDLVGAPDVAARWGALTIEPRRAVLRAVVDVRVNRGRPGVGRIEPGRLQLRFLGEADWRG